LTRLTIHFIGTGSGAPSLARGSPAILVRREGVGLLFDCGEATQLAMRRSKAKFRGLEAVFISHMHGDHLLGLPGLIMTLSLNTNLKRLRVYGPTGLAHYLECVFKATAFEPKFDVSVTELLPCETPKAIHRGDGFTVLAVSSKHVIQSFAYALIEDDRPGKFNVERAIELGVPRGPLWSELQRGRSVKVGDRTIEPLQVLGEKRRGRKIVYSGDTRPCEAVLELGRGSDVFIHEATFADRDIEDALAGGHSTLGEAVDLLKRSGCRLGVLTNLGQKITKEDLEKLVLVDSNIIVASDGLTLEVPLP